MAIKATKKRARSAPVAASPQVASPRVGVCAPSGAVPSEELARGVARMREAGFDVVVHPHTGERHLFFAGDDESRAAALWEMACDPSLPIVWAARGGYGAARLLILLDALWERAIRDGSSKPPRGKLWVGYSDSTALLEYVRGKWGWNTVHGEMPGTPKFFGQTPADWKALSAWVRGIRMPAPWEKKKLGVWSTGPSASSSAVEAEIVGGNLSVFTSLIGTPHAIPVVGKILFLEEIDEALYRVDRLVQQCLASGAWRGVRAIALGEMTACVDRVPLVNGKPLRAMIPAARGLRAIFERAGRQLGVPVVAGLPIGHGPGHSPIPMGARAALEINGARAQLRLVSWAGWRD